MLQSMDSIVSILLLVHMIGSGAILGMYYKRVEVTTKVVVEGDLDKEFGGEWEKYEATAVRNCYCLL